MSNTNRNIFSPSPRTTPAQHGLEGVIQQQLQLAKQLQSRGELEPAIQIYEGALKVVPHHPAVLSNLTLCLIQKGAEIRAIELLKKSLQTTPKNEVIRSSLIAAYISSKQNDEALKEADLNIELHPASAPASFQRAQILISSSRQVDSIAELRRTLKLAPTNSRHIQTLASQLLSVGEYKEALKLFEEQFKNAPNSVDVLNNYASTEAHCGATMKAIEHFDLARDQANSALALLRSAVARIPIIDDGKLDLTQLEAQAAELLKSVLNQLNTQDVRDAINLVTHASNYYLAYQDHHHRLLLDLMGDVCTTAMTDSVRSWGVNLAPALAGTNVKPREKLRIGFVSAHVKNHSVWNAITRGWVKLLTNSGHQIGIINLGSGDDDMTAEAKQFTHEYISGERGVKEWAFSIAEKQFDILIYPEIGMSPLTRQLASLRLARVQAASWGHPQSSGLSTIDYYLSGELFESNQSDQYYREKLVKLPGLGVAYEAVVGNSEPLDLALQGIDHESPIFICAGTPIKYHRNYDHLLIQIAKQLPHAQFVFFVHPMFAGASHVMHERMRHSFQSSGMNLDDHYRELKWLSPAQFKYLMEQSTAFLDTTVFSGFNTVLQAMDAALPVVTKRGKYLRSNLGAAPLQAIGMGDTICDTDEQFIDLAVKLAETNYRQQLSSRVREGIASTNLTHPHLARAINDWIIQSTASN